MRFSTLSSGSKANVTFVEISGIRILIDVGLSARETERRLIAIGIPPDSISAILITHEHSDHIRGVSRFSLKHKVPVWSNEKTGKFLPDVYGKDFFKSGSVFELTKEVKVRAFPIPHDAVDPVGFCISGDGIKFGYATDLGKVTPVVEDALQGCNGVVIESNHEEELLWSCQYPWELKQRIASNYGHLSNEMCGNLLKSITHPYLKHVVLGHISENSNTPDHALKIAKSVLSEGHEIEVYCGSVKENTQLFNLNNENSLNQKRFYL